MTPKQTSNKYASIQTEAELEQAILTVHEQRVKAEKGLGRDINRLWRHYQPTNLVSSFVRQYTPLFSWTGIGLAVVRGLRKMIAGPKEEPGPAEKISA